MKTKNTSVTNVAIVGGGVAGATAAVHLSAIGVDVTLLERGSGLVDGPPICHLHAGGNLYRDISPQQCIKLLKQSIDSVRLFPHTINKRPTVLAIPKYDPGSPNSIIERLETIVAAYRELVANDEKNNVLGDADDYYKVYYRNDIEKFLSQELCTSPSTLDEWMIPFAKFTDLEKIKYPVVIVQEYGWSVFRLAASIGLALEEFSNCQVLVNSNVIDTKFNNEHSEWDIEYENAEGEVCHLRSQYLINACGYETGNIDDHIKAKRKRMVEFKSAYVARWVDHSVEWPEVVFHGERGTPTGMAQFTPYGNGVFQLHGMTHGITLFEKGLVASSDQSSQPVLPDYLQAKLSDGWKDIAIEKHTERAIDYLSQFIPQFDSAVVESKPLFGAQQIPGDDESLRAADVSFEANNYARMEVVKGSSALEAAVKIVEQWSLVPKQDYGQKSIEELHPISIGLSSEVIEQYAIQLAKQRNYPIELAQVSGQD
ncbi:FAD-dependent oxidoreductase [Vibrio sp. WJH972]